MSSGRRERIKDSENVFVTVGSTSFDGLVQTVTEERFRKASVRPSLYNNTAQFSTVYRVRISLSNHSVLCSGFAVSRLR